MKDKDLKKQIIIVAFLIVLTIIFAIVIPNNKVETIEEENLGWRTGLEPMTYMSIRDNASNICNKKYYSHSFEIRDNKLYDFNNNLIADDMFTISLIKYSDCEVEIIFVTSNDGNLYYVNNMVNSSLKKYELVKIPEVENITSVTTDDSGQIIAIDFNSSETGIQESFNELVSAKDFIK